MQIATRIFLTSQAMGDFSGFMLLLEAMHSVPKIVL